VIAQDHKTGCADVVLQRDNAFADAAFEQLIGEESEPALDLVDPRMAGGLVGDEVRQAVAERKPKRWRRNAARRSGIAIRLNRANGTYSAA
jgi:hypothetical protein